MCLNMIDPATSWLVMSELPVMDEVSPTGAVQNEFPEQNISIRTKETFIDKSSIMISNLVNNAGLADTHAVRKLYSTMRVSSNSTS